MFKCIKFSPGLPDKPNKRPIGQGKQTERARRGGAAPSAEAERPPLGREPGGWGRRPATPQLGIKSGRGPARSPSPGPSGAAALQVSLLLVHGADVLGGARNVAGGARNAAESSSRSGAGVALRCQARASAAARDPNALQAPCCARLWVLRTPSGASLPLAAPDLAGSPSRGVRKQQVREWSPALYGLIARAMAHFFLATSLHRAPSGRRSPS
ncbi:uncharacterized protein LOC117795753 [Ailuropoda melanoleuca]|uniref:uncharacterized protein LOC117795753 n=1 Tax=Ailuropoda melanoleuca TaxID=9646 RepID=UPI0014945156|nr:uncharacterized protein LOC117795753 [Ailuropoda melanoleuca]